MIHCDGHILISFLFPQFISFHSVFHSFHGLMNSINWPALSIWVVIAQLGEHCSANAEAMGSNPVEAPKKPFLGGYFRNCLNCDSLRWSHTHFICIPAVHIISFSVSFLSRVDELNKLATPSIWVFIAQLGEHCSTNAEATGSNPVEAPKKPFFRVIFAIA